MTDTLKTLKTESQRNQDIGKNKEQRVEFGYNADVYLFELNRALDTCENGAPRNNGIHNIVLKTSNIHQNVHCYN